MWKYSDEDLKFFMETEKAAHATNMSGQGVDLNHTIILSHDAENVNNNLRTVSALELQSLDLPPLMFVAEGLLPQGLNILASPPKYGKSWLVLDLCLSVASGAPFLGHKTNSGNCLYLALEDSLHRLQDRMDKVLGGGQAPPGFEFAIQCKDLSNGLIEQLEEYITNKPGTVLIAIDTFQKIRGKANRSESAYAADYREMAKLKELSDKHKMCLLLVHHLRKMSDDSDVFNRISGTNGISGAADTMLVLSKSKRTDSETILSVTGRDVDSSETVLEFDKATHKWRVIGSAEERAEELARREYEKDPIVITVKQLLEENPLGCSYTAEDLRLTCVEKAGAYPADNAIALSKRLRKLAPMLFVNDQIIYRPPSKNGSHGARKHTFHRANYQSSCM